MPAVVVAEAQPLSYQKGPLMLDWLKVIIMGVVQGITEFLPISSTGHLIVAAALLDFNQRLDATFEIFIQIGSVVAVLAFYRTDILRQIRAVPRDTGVQRFWLAIVIACVPAVIIGFLFQDWIQSVLYSPLTVAVSLIVGGAIFLLVERRPIPAHTTATTAISPIQAVAIGVAQVIALIPGVSRSGATIIGGMLAGLDRRTAAEFSFYLAIPMLGGVTLYELVSNLDTLSSGDLAYLLVGAAVAAVVSWIVIGWLLRYIAAHSFRSFGYYRILAGIIILLLVAAGLPLK